MSLYAKLKDAVALNSDSKALLAMYWHWSRQFHRFNGKRASEWTGDDVVRTAFPTVNFLENQV